MEAPANSSAAVPLNGSLGAPLSPSAAAAYSPGAVAGLASVVGFLIVFTIVGNVLVVIAVLTSRALRAPQNLFLVSLASADILVAALVMPFSLANELMGAWHFGKAWCNIYLALDVLFCTSSIVHLCAISLDRYWSVTQAVEYNQKRTPRRIKGIIVLVWLLSALISSPPLVSKYWLPPGEAPTACQLNDETWYILSSCIGSFFAPCLIMGLVYVRIYRVAKLRTRTLSEKRPGAHGEAENGALRASGAARGYLSLRSPPPRRENGWEPGAAELHDVELEDESSSLESRRRPDGGRRGQAQGKRPRPSASCRAPSVGGGGRLPSRSSLRSLEFFSSHRRKRRASSAGARAAASQAREKRFTFVLAVVMGVFVVCWSPFFFSYSLYGICREACEVPEALFKFFFWIGYCNSSLNPVIYTIFNQDFRRAFKHILLGRTRSRRRRRRKKKERKGPFWH